MERKEKELRKQEEREEEREEERDAREADIHHLEKENESLEFQLGKLGKSLNHEKAETMTLTMTMTMTMTLNPQLKG